MCGICGIIHTRDGRPVERAQLETMARSMRHRGPDSEGFHLEGNVGLGHQRLQIIDLSPLGHQPMLSPDGRFSIVFNGEIYNYIELRQNLIQKGYTFRSHSDTEVLLHLFEEHGPDCVRHLIGMFAFAVWDRSSKELFAARDHFGIKPFYYVQQDDRFAFASEIKAFLHAGLLDASLDREGLSDYLTFQFCLGDKTLFRGVKKLLPGHSLRLKAGGEVVVAKYWDLDFAIDTHHTEEYFEHQLLRLLEDSVRIQLRADVPVGAHLSGGLDSSTVSCLAASLLGSPIHTFTGAFRESPAYDETRYARAVSDQIGAIAHTVYPTADDFVGNLPRIMYHMDEPAAGPGVFPQFMVSRLASQNVKVVMGGQGGDEIFGGYTRYLIAYLEECLRGGIEGTQDEGRYVVSFESILPNLQQLQGYQPLLRHFWKDGLFDAPERRYFRLIDRSSDIRPHLRGELLASLGDYNPFDSYHATFNEVGHVSYINKMTRFDLKTLLPALLQVEDRTSMAVSLESRVPLLDHRVAELVASTPPMIKYRGGRSKHLFRQVVQHVVPPVIHERKDKMGFPVPLTEWYREGVVRDFVSDMLLGPEAQAGAFHNPKSVEGLLKGERSYGRTVWGLLSLEVWRRAFLHGPVRLS